MGSNVQVVWEKFCRYWDVDAASGGFVAPFLQPDLEWDFRLPQVKSINVSGHKYGLTYPGIGFVVWRSEADLHVSSAIVVREGFGLDLADSLIEALQKAVDHLTAYPPARPPDGTGFSHI